VKTGAQKKKPVRLLQTDGTMQTVCRKTHQMPSVCLEEVSDYNRLDNPSQKKARDLK